MEVGTELAIDALADHGGDDFFAKNDAADIGSFGLGDEFLD